MSETTVKRPHTLMLDNRGLLSMTGVEDVSGFDESAVMVRIADGALVIKGEGLHISKLSLDSGDVVIDGRINAMQYLGAGTKNLRSRLFK